MPRICLLALIGLPGAGKTSLCDWLLQHQRCLGGWDVMHLCYDDHFDIKSEYKSQRFFIYSLLTQLIGAIQSGVRPTPAGVRCAPKPVKNNDNYLILCDDNHYYRSMRYKLYQLCRSQNCHYAQIYVTTSLDACLQANEARGPAGVPAAVIHQMYERLEEPNESVTWEQFTYKLKATDYPAAAPAIKQFIQLVLRSEVPVAPLDRVKQPQLQSLIHELDLGLRGRIQTLMKAKDDVEQQSRQERSRALVEQRKQILAQFRVDIRSRQTECSDLDLEYYVNMLK